MDIQSIKTYVVGWFENYELNSNDLPEGYKLADEELMGDWRKDVNVVLPFVLGDANDIRRACAIGDGKMDELPKGVVGEQKDCVLAVALSNGWEANVSTTEVTLSYPIEHHNADGSINQEGKTLTDISKTVDALTQLGFLGVKHYPEATEADQLYFREWTIEIPHTYAMSAFVDNFDSRRYPHLILGDESTGCDDPDCDQCNPDS